MFNTTLSKVIVSITVSLIIVVGILFLLTNSFNKNIEETNNNETIKEGVLK